MMEPVCGIINNLLGGGVISEDNCLPVVAEMYNQNCLLIHKKQKILKKKLYHYYYTVIM